MVVRKREWLTARIPGPKRGNGCGSEHFPRGVRDDPEGYSQELGCRAMGAPRAPGSHWIVEPYYLGWGLNFVFSVY